MSTIIIVNKAGCAYLFSQSLNNSINFCTKFHKKYILVTFLYYFYKQNCSIDQLNLLLQSFKSSNHRLDPTSARTSSRTSAGHFRIFFAAPGTRTTLFNSLFRYSLGTRFRRYDLGGALETQPHGFLWHRRWCFIRPFYDWSFI